MLAISWAIQVGGSSGPIGTLAGTGLVMVGCSAGWFVFWNMLLGPFPGIREIGVQLVTMAGVIAAMPLTGGELVIATGIVWMPAPILGVMALFLWKPGREKHQMEATGSPAGADVPRQKP